MQTIQNYNSQNCSEKLIIEQLKQCFCQKKLIIRLCEHAIKESHKNNHDVIKIELEIWKR